MPRWTLSLSDDLARRVQERLAENCQNRNEVLRFLLERYVEMPAWSLTPSETHDAKQKTARKSKVVAPKKSQESKRLKRPPPTRSQLVEAQKLAAILGCEIPDEALPFSSACSDFIRQAREESATTE